MTKPSPAKSFPMSARLLAMMAGLALLPLLIYVVSVRYGGLPEGRSLMAAALAGLAGVFFAFRCAMAGLVSPVTKVFAAIGAFVAADYKLNSVIPKAGWPEAGNMISALNRLMLELSAYRAFHLNQVIEEKSKAQALIETITDGVLLIDDRGRLIHSNKLALKFLGVPSLDSGAPVIQEAGKEEFRQALKEILASTENLIKREVSIALSGEKDSPHKVFRLISRQFTIASLERPGRVIMIRDVTLDMEIENARETFFQMITHDMRAPLASIQGYAQMLKIKSDKTPDSEKCLHAIIRSSTRLNGMISDILNTIKLERGEMKPQLSDIDAASLCGLVHEIHAPLAERKGLTLTITPPPGKVVFQGDPVLLERVISNLIGNALKFTPSGGAIELSCRGGDGQVYFSVKDTGPGIPKDKTEDIFAKYSQLEEHKFMGFGLGLAMCKMAVELHGGRIRVESEEGRGSEFIFNLPEKQN